MKKILTAKRIVKNALHRLGLLIPAYRMYERVLAVVTTERAKRTVDGLPVPPAYLRILVAGTADVEWFLSRGAADAASITAALRQAGSSIDDVESILDFGCGCGRVTRYWHGLRGADIHGCDHDPRPIDWCRRNLTFAEFEVNGLHPPLPYGDSSFDLVYGLSVFTHLAGDLQVAWLGELTRILRPGGHLIFSTAGRYYIDRLTPEERHEFERGEMVVRFAEAAGTNVCTAYHPRRFVVEQFGRELEPVGFVEGRAEAGYQDLHVFRR